MTAHDKSLRAAPAGATSILKLLRVAIPKWRLQKGTLERRFGGTRMSRTEVQTLFHEELGASRANIMYRATWRGHDDQKVDF